VKKARTSGKKADLRRDEILEKVKLLVGELKETYHLSESEIIETISKEDYVPVTIFNDTLSSYEAIAKFLKENKGKKLREIAALTGRSSASIWQTYRNAHKKYKRKLQIKETRFLIPLRIISEKKFSILESIVVYLKEKFGLNYRQIGKLMHRDERTIWTVYNRGIKKR